MLSINLIYEVFPRSVGTGVAFAVIIATKLYNYVENRREK
jgi:hypothetical protein